MSSDINIFCNAEDNSKVSTRINKVWEHEKYADDNTVYSFEVRTQTRDAVTFFCTLSQLETIREAIDTFTAQAVDVPEPTINDLAKMKAESEGISLS